MCLYTFTSCNGIILKYERYINGKSDINAFSYVILIYGRMATDVTLSV